MASHSWHLLIYRLPAEPSRHRVAVWRELRRAGAVALQQATWALPGGELFDAALARAVELVERGAGESHVFDVAGSEVHLSRLESLFTAEREEEWSEFLSACAKHAAELAGEAARSRFTLAGLNEEERVQERLRRWYRELWSRDLFGAPSAPAAEQGLRECTAALEDFAQRVFQARQR